MRDVEVADLVADKIVKKIMPIIKKLLSKNGDDELSIADLKAEYPRASPYLVRKWCKQGDLLCWTSGDSSNSKYVFRREDFENLYYSRIGKKGD